MKKLIIIAFILLTACSQQAPSFLDENGNTVNLSDYQGKWVFINYYASWCKPCYEELPELNAFYKAHKDKDAVVLGVNYDMEQGSKLKAIIEKMGVTFPTLSSDPKTVIGVEQVSGLPTTYVLGPQGKLRKTLLGKQTQKSLEDATKA